ncbi:PREDICTED: uncharacterized protein LOC104778997 [Camelina sativa]|uniref:Uncharacterized protein LOC104778997 n=1 Tax=Camelina sativa TaxID=90675 RepID=A0ABM0YJ17_CAMSA|nr:PREDICTED: uncharacterized protein LOC104778997 [Camelina sativa]
MGKRNCKSKYRSETPDPLDITSPRSRELPYGSIQARRDSDVQDTNQTRAMFPKRSPHHIEVSNSPDNVHNGTNYGTWIVAMTTSIEAKNKLGFIDGSIVKPDEDDPYCKIWSRCNSMVKSWLLNSVTPKIYTSILYTKTASDIWKDLHTRFHKSNLPRLYKLRHRIHSLRQGSMTLSSYHTQTQSLWAELSSLQATAHSVEALIAERETNRVIDFLMGLNDNYDTVRSQIPMKKTLPTMSEVYNLLDQEDSQKSARLPSHTSVDPTAFQVSNTQVQFNVVTLGQGQQYGGDSVNQRKDKPVCTFCGRSGHIAERCYKRVGYPAHFKLKHKGSVLALANVAIGETSETLSASSDDLTPTQIQQLMSYLSTKLQSSSTITKPEVHSVLVSKPFSSTVFPISGKFDPSILCSFSGNVRPYACSVNSNAIAINAWVVDS